MEYLKYKKLIVNLCHKYAKPGYFGLEFDDLYSLGNEIFISANKNYNPEQGAFSTYLHNYISKSFFNIRTNKLIAKREKIFHYHKTIVYDHNAADGESGFNWLFFESKENAQSLSDGNNSLDIERQCIFIDGLNKLSDNSIKLINLILNMPDKMKNEIPKINKTNIRNYLCDKLPKEWNHYIVNNAYAEIADYMRE